MWKETNNYTQKHGESERQSVERDIKTDKNRERESETECRRRHKTDKYRESERQCRKRHKNRQKQGKRVRDKVQKGTQKQTKTGRVRDSVERDIKTDKNRGRE